MNRKYFKIGWLLLPLLLVGISACERSNADNPVLPNISNAKAPVLHLGKEMTKEIAIDLDNLGVLELTWDAANLGEQIPVNYTLIATAGDKSVEFPTTSGRNKVEIDHKTLNEKALGELGLEVDKKATITFVVTASPLLDSGSPALKDATVSSAPLEITLTPTKPKFPEKLYMIGQEFGNWGWDSDGVVEMTPVNSHPGMLVASSGIPLVLGEATSLLLKRVSALPHTIITPLLISLASICSSWITLPRPSPLNQLRSLVLAMPSVAGIQVSTHSRPRVARW